jgi:hypothetical protein
LLRLRTLVFGSSAAGFAECPQCAGRIEFPIDTTALLQPKVSGTAPHELEIDGTRLRFRLPTSHDLAVTVAARDASQALREVIARCVVAVDPPTDWPNDTVAALGRAMLQADPQAEITLAISCPSCGHAWEMLFDIAHFFWNEIAAEARRILREIDALARAYGWSEREILGLSAARRQSYLELVAA